MIQLALNDASNLAILSKNCSVDDLHQSPIENLKLLIQVMQLSDVERGYGENTMKTNKWTYYGTCVDKRPAEEKRYKQLFEGNKLETMVILCLSHKSENLPT